MLNPDGGVIDDLIIYYIGDTDYRLVVNAATREKDLAWIRSRPSIRCDVIERAELAMIAVQGPNARELAAPCIDAEYRDAALALKPFFGMQAGDCSSRAPATRAKTAGKSLCRRRAHAVWDQLLAAGVVPCGLGARDTLRLEAAMNLYGTDMDETISPLEAGLGWTVAWEPAIATSSAARAGGVAELRTDALCRSAAGRQGVLRNHQKVVVEGVGEGEITSGGFSPTIGDQLRWHACRRATTTERRSRSEANC